MGKSSMKSLTNDARGFVEGVVTQLKKTGKASAMTPKVETLLMRMTSSARKERHAIVETAVKLTSDEARLIERILSKVSGHSVLLEMRIDPDLIAGIRIQMADWVMDTSMKSELSLMATMLQSQ